MLDTQVLVYAVRKPRKGDSPETVDLTRRSQALVHSQPTITISAITTMEFLRGVRPDEREAAEALLAKTEAEMVDHRVAEHAHRLMAKRVGSRRVCERCLGAHDEHPCKVCKRLVSNDQRLRDALIIATADLLPDVSTLYSFDGGVLAYTSDVNRVAIAKPASADGPLFEAGPTPSSK